MQTSAVHPPLSNIQPELLKVFSAEIPDQHLAEPKKLIAGFLPDSALMVYDGKGSSDEKLHQMLHDK